MGKQRRYISELILSKIRNSPINFNVSFPNYNFNFKFFINNITN